MSADDNRSKSNLNGNKTPRKADTAKGQTLSRSGSSRTKDASTTPRTKTQVPPIPVPDESLWEKWDTPQLIAWLRSRKLNEETYNPCWRIIEEFSLRGASLVTLNARTLVELKIKRAQAVVILDEVKALKKRVPSKLYDDSEEEEEDDDGLDDPVSENSRSRSKSRGGAPSTQRDASDEDKTTASGAGDSVRGGNRSEHKSGDLKGATPRSARQRKEDKKKQEEEEDEELEQAEVEELTEAERLMRAVFGDDDKDDGAEESDEEADGRAANGQGRSLSAAETANKAKSLFSCCFCASAEQPIKQEDPSARFLRRSKQRARKMGLNNKQFLELLTRKAKAQNPRATEADLVEQILVDRQTAQIRKRRQARKLTKVRDAAQAAETAAPSLSVEMERRRRYQNNA